MKTQLKPDDKLDLMMVITQVIRNRFENVVKEAHTQPFAGNQSGPVKIVPLDAVGHQMVEQVLNDLTDTVRKM